MSVNVTGEVVAQVSVSPRVLNWRDDEQTGRRIAEFLVWSNFDPPLGEVSRIDAPNGVESSEVQGSAKFRRFRVVAHKGDARERTEILTIVFADGRTAVVDIR
jgi:hypothetical protein